MANLLGVDINAIKKRVRERLYALDDEYKTLGKQPTRFSLPDESFWGVDLGDGYVMFCNDLLEFFGGPRGSSGMVGRHDGRGNVDAKASLELLVKAGQAAVDYYHRSRKKTP